MFEDKYVSFQQKLELLVVPLGWKLKKNINKTLVP